MPSPYPYHFLCTRGVFVDSNIWTCRPHRLPLRATGFEHRVGARADDERHVIPVIDHDLLLVSVGLRERQVGADTVVDLQDSVQVHGIQRIRSDRQPTRPCRRR